MVLGLLLCDHVRPGFQWLEGDYPDFFRRLFAGHPLELTSFDLPAGDFPVELDRCDAWIISGSRHSVYDRVAWVERLADLVRTFDRERRKLVGVCFGAQMIGHALGGVVAQAPQGWQVGTKEVVLNKKAPWMDPPAPRFRILCSNADQVLVPPDRMRVLGSSPEIPVSVTAVDDHLVGFQGHPEFSVEYAALLMEARRGTVIPDGTVDAGLASLADGPDTDLLAGWIARFLLA
ncbi:MAG TPA: hypothetical protein VLA54_13765 [Acidimicrobiia bacterium]|nr:hypothetical protein [Acidimicrobiia bacterium]